MTSAWVRGNVFQEARPGAGFKTGAISVNKNWGGAATVVERLLTRPKHDR